MVFLFAGSLLIGRTLEESDMLKRRVSQLVEAGLGAEYLSSSDLRMKEPAVMVEKEGGAAFLPDDCQLDAHRAVAFIRKVSLLFLLLIVILVVLQPFLIMHHSFLAKQYNCGFYRLMRLLHREADMWSTSMIRLLYC